MEEYLDFAKKLAVQAGAIMREHFTVGVANETKKSDDDTPVTTADRAINQLVIETVAGTYPDHGVVGEEQSTPAGTSGYSWVCDPVDGTIPYVMGAPFNVFSLALVGADGQPVVAVVYDPYMDRMYWATIGGGAYMNGDRLQVNTIGGMKVAYIGNSGGTSDVLNPIEYRQAVIAECYRPLVLCCVIYEAMLVASGQIAATASMGSGAWDVASAKLIVEEAGGKVTDLFGEDQRYDQPVRGALISNGRVHEQMITIGLNVKIDQESINK